MNGKVNKTCELEPSDSQALSTISTCPFVYLGTNNPYHAVRGHYKEVVRSPSSDRIPKEGASSLKLWHRYP